MDLLDADSEPGICRNIVADLLNVYILDIKRDNECIVVNVDLFL